MAAASRAAITMDDLAFSLANYDKSAAARFRRPTTIDDDSVLSVVRRLFLLTLIFPVSFVFLVLDESGS